MARKVLTVDERRIAYEERTRHYRQKAVHLRMMRNDNRPHYFTIYSHKFMIESRTTVAERTRRYKERHG